MFLIFFGLLIITAFIVSKLYKKLKLQKSFTKYNFALKQISSINFQKEISQNEIILKNISNEGMILLLKLIILFLPYMFIFYILSIYGINIYIKYLLPSLPYLVMFKKK